MPNTVFTIINKPVYGNDTLYIHFTLFNNYYILNYNKRQFMYIVLLVSFVTLYH